MKIAVDAMGGDNSPAVEVEGAVLAAIEFDVDIILVGNRALVEPELAKQLEKYKVGPDKVTIVHASEQITMDDQPSMAVRKKRDSSVSVAMSLVKDGEADAVVSAGNTGAVMATALFTLGRLKDVERPVIATVLPTVSGKTILLDIGANVDCKPTQLAQFAIMGHEYAKVVLGKKSPTVGLLSIGEEEAKGNDLTRETFKILKKLPLNFKGNVEGRDIFAGTADVIVCDGFIGNVVLKVSEGLFDTIAKTLQKEINSSLIAKIGALLSRNAFRNFKNRFDYTEYGGAPLIGLEGICIICHGSSPVKAVKNAVKLSKLLVEQQINMHIQSDIEQSIYFFKQQKVNG